VGGEFLNWWKGVFEVERWNLCDLRAAEVCSAEATELPVWERPPVSVANGLCHPWTLDHGSHAGMTRLLVWSDLFRVLVVVSKRLDPGSQAGMTRLLLCSGLFWGLVDISKRLDHGSQAVMTRFYSLACFVS